MKIRILILNFETISESEFNNSRFFRLDDLCFEHLGFISNFVLRNSNL